jgi:poly(3-hydroxybutyrate) depolymerase
MPLVALIAAAAAAAAPGMPSVAGFAAALPRLAIDPAKISISGLSSGADFTVQQLVAYSSLYCGAGVFAGQTCVLLAPALNH